MAAKKSKKPSVVVFGEGDLAVAILEEMSETFTVQLVVTRPPQEERPVDGTRETSEEWAKDNGVDVVAFEASQQEQIVERVNAFDDLAFVRNATDGVNAVLRSLPWDSGEEILVTSHGYNACSNAAHFVAERNGGRVAVADIPFPIASAQDVLEAIKAACTDWTRLILVDHITSPTGIILPVAEIVAFAHAHGIRVLVDAAHAPGMVDVSLDETGADYTTGNLHKWICGPKTSGFLHVRRELQDEVRPCVISHAANTERPNRSRFLAEFDWTGTFDPTALLSVPKAIDFLETVLPEGGLSAVMRANHGLVIAGRDLVAESLDVEPPAPNEMLGSLAALELPAGPPPETGRTDELQQRLFRDHRIEVPIFHWQGRRLIRLSAQVYNDLSDYEALASALRSELIGA